MPTQTHYTTLDLLSPAAQANAPPKSAALRQKYRAALLRAHPDKKERASASASTETKPSRSGSTVDDVKLAFSILDDAVRRREYDALLLRASSRSNAGVEGETGVGVETLDLCDFQEGVEDGEGVWWRGCRCGDEKGFFITEEELAGVEGEGGGEVMVGCSGCSLWVRVGFAVE